MKLAIRAATRGVAVAVLLLGLSGRTSAGFLDPNAFTSLGASPSAVGTYTFDTGAVVRPTLTGPGGTINGVYFTDVPGHTIAVFAFDSIAIGNGMTFTGGGANVLALLSRGDVTISGTGKIDLSGRTGGTDFGAGTPIVGGPGSGGPGGGGGGDVGGTGTPTGGGPGGGLFLGGGGFGGNGSGPGGGSGGGISYGNLTAFLQGGSGGSSGAGRGNGGGGGGGGGLEIGAIGNITIGGAGVLSNGGDGGPGIGGGGGGSGGGLLLHADSVRLTSILSARGGIGGRGTILGGGSGGGGRVLIQVGDEQFSNLGTIDVQGGRASTGLGGVLGRDGLPGEVVIVSGSVPEPASIVIFGTGVLGLVLYGWRKTG